MFSRSAVAAALASLATFHAVSACDTSADCAGNLDCVRLGLSFTKKCVPLSCAKGAVEAVFETGFSGREYMNQLRGQIGLRGAVESFTDIETEKPSIMEAMKSSPPPTDVLMKNYTACINPTPEDGRQAPEQQTESTTFEGVQTSFALGFSYFEKEFSGEYFGFDYTITSQCNGFMLGADAGYDFMWHIENRASRRRLEDSGNEQYDIGDTEFIPLVIGGPVGIQYGYDPDIDQNEFNILEITLGASLGAGVGGFNTCENQIQ